MPQTDILDADSVTIPASSDGFGAWCTTFGAREVVFASTYLAGSGMNHYVQESIDGSTVVQEFLLSATTRTHKPASAYIRVRIQNTNASPVPVDYSLRGLS